MLRYESSTHTDPTDAIVSFKVIMLLSKMVPVFLEIEITEQNVKSFKIIEKKNKKRGLLL